MMKKEYEKPEVVRMEFDYSKVMTTSGGGSRCAIAGMAVYFDNPTDVCVNYAPGDQ